jgi:hydroxymethylglutaryl-CoA reductase (NADPH)
MTLPPFRMKTKDPDPRTRKALPSSHSGRDSSSSRLEQRRVKRSSRTVRPLVSRFSSYAFDSDSVLAPSASADPCSRAQIASFLVLHALNLVTTLTTQTALDRHTEHSPSSPHALTVDTNSPLLSAALAQLVASHERGTDLIVHLAPALQYRAIDPTVPVYTSRPAAHEELSTATGSLANLDRFMSRWSRLVGDPIISKWIVIALGISVFLNGYLLKGIASGSDSGFAPGSAAEAAARILLASTGSAIDEDDSDTKAKLRHSFIALKDDLQNEWTARDAAAMTRQHQREEDIAEAEAEKPAPSVVKISTTKARRDSGSSSEGSPPPSPIFVRTKPRKAATSTSSRSTATSSNATSVETSAPSIPTLALPEAQREIKLSPSTVALVPLGNVPDTPRDLEVCVKIFDGGEGALLLNDEEIIMLVQKGKVAAYALEKLLKDYERSVAIRRALICEFWLSCRLVRFSPVMLILTACPP